MKRISILLAICLLLGLPAQAAAPAVFQYQSSRLEFSVTVPGIRQGEVIAEETDTGVSFYHAPSREKYGGEIGSVVVVSPRSDFFSGHYDDMAYQIIAMGKDQVFLWKVPGGGAPTGGDFLDAFRRVSSAFSMENLRKGLVPPQPDAWPKLQTTRHLAYLPVSGGLARPNAPLTRGELAQMLYTLLDAGNKADSYRVPFSDTAGKDCAQAVAYLASYGILTGYAERRTRRSAGPRSPFCCTAVSLRHLWGSMGKNLCLRMFLPGTGPKRTSTARKFWAGCREMLMGCSARNAKSPVLKRSLPSTGCSDGMNL